MGNASPGALRRGPALAAGIVLLLALAAYGPSLDGDFVWDDRPLIVENSWVQQADEIRHLFTSSFWDSGDRHDRFRSFYRPLVSLSYFLDHLAWGLEPLGYRVTNLLWHLLVCALVYAIARGEQLGRGAAAVGAALFAVHPVHVESVAWISGRTDVICTALTLAAFLAYRVRRAGRGRWASVLSLVAFALALSAKEMAATLPLLVALDRWLSARSEPNRLRETVAGALPYAAVLAGYLAVRVLVLGGVGQPLYELAPLAWASTALFVVARYLVLLILPFGLDAHYPDPPLDGPLSALVVVSTIVLALAAWGAWRLRRSASVYWVIWIPVSLLPVMAFGRFGDVLLADRFLYLPSVGLAMLAARAAAAGFDRERVRRWAIVASCAVLPFLAFKSATRSSVWETDLALFSDMASTSPGSALVRCNLGLAYYHRGEIDEAIREFREAIALVPGYSMAHNNLAAALETRGRHREALQHYLTALRYAPGHVEASVNAGHLMTRLGQAQRGLEVLRGIVEEHPDHARALYALAEALERIGRGEAAVPYLLRARDTDPTYPNTWYLLGKIRWRQGRPAEAGRALETFLELWEREDAFAADARDMLTADAPMAHGSR